MSVASRASLRQRVRIVSGVLSAVLLLVLGWNVLRAFVFGHREEAYLDLNAESALLAIILCLHVGALWRTLRSGRTNPTSAPTLPRVMSDRVKQLAPTQKIQAIQVYREETGAGLADAKNAVEAFLAAR